MSIVHEEDTHDADTGFAKPTPDQEAVTDVLYDNTERHPLAPANPASPEPAERFYGHSQLAQTIDQRGKELWAETGASLAQQKELRNTFVNIARGGVPEAITALVAAYHLDALLADARLNDDPEGDALKLDKQVLAWSAESREFFAARYGSQKDGEAMLGRVQRYVRAHPAFAKIVQQHGIGSRPDVVEAIADFVFSTGWRG